MKRYSLIMGCRGGGRIYYWSKRIGYEKLLCEGIKLKIKYPLWHDMDEILTKIQKAHSYYCRKSQLF